METKTPGNPPRLLLTPQQAADSLGLGRSRIYELLHDHELHSVKIGRSRRIPYASLLDFIEGLDRKAEVSDERPA